MSSLIGVTTTVVLVLLSALILYQWILALASFLFRAPTPGEAQDPRTRFLLLIPAHNEEAGIVSTLDSIHALAYPQEQTQVLVIADRCTDGTATIVKASGVHCFERTEGQAGKGAAIAWGIQKAMKALSTFDAVVIIDADTLVDRRLLSAFDVAFRAGHQIQQGYNYISNPWASPFTRIMAVTGVLRNGRYYTGKSAIGLQGMLTGTGMCLGTKTLEQHGWNAFSVGEDWEFSVKLLLAGERIYFNPIAKTFAKESQNFKQASRQRLRWASGRYAVMGNTVWELIMRGLGTKTPSLIDSAVTLVAPNYSSQASLAILCVLGGLTNYGDPQWGFTLPWTGMVLFGIACYFLLGVCSTESPGRALAGLMLVPVFLPWRLAIELLGLFGYGRGHWGRMSRASDRTQPTPR